MIDAHPRARTNKLWICRSCRRGTLGESACEYCSAPRMGDAPVTPAAATGPPAARVAPSEPRKKRRARPRLLTVVLLVAALVAGGLFVKSHSGSSNASSVASAPSAYVPPQRHIPAPRAVALPAALTAAPASGDVITPSLATAVVQAAWDLHHQALAQHDVPLAAAFETGPALDIDAAREGNGDPYGSTSQVVVSVPHQATFPARFLAQVATTKAQQPWIAFLVLSRADTRSPWMLELMGGYAAPSTAIKPPPVDAGGFVTPQTAHPLVDPTTVHGLLAQYWRFSADNGKVPPAPLWESGQWTTQYAAQLSRSHQGVAYQVAPNGPSYVFPQAEGWQIVCSAIYMQQTSPSSGGGRQVTKNGIAVPCIEVPPAGPGNKVRVLGAQEYTDVTTYK